MEITVKSAVNPRFSNKEKTAIDLDVEFSHINEPLPFTSIKGEEGYTGDLFEKAISGEYGEIQPWVDTTFEYNTKVSMKIQSDALIKATATIDTLTDKIEFRGSTPELEDLLKRLKIYRMDVMDLDEDPKWPYVDFPEFPV